MGWVNINGVPHPDWFFAEECPCANDRPEDCPDHGEAHALSQLPESVVDGEDAERALAAAIIDWELTENVEFWRARRAAR
ncbi:hypothetical protein PBI_INDLOVU_94 [Mycobacterium phage Indlovu]|nr:hypothetical protein PBI_INDLOVU_94 [Mycobacterium phage Indlovu]